MKKYFTYCIVFGCFIAMPAFAVDAPLAPYSETLPQSAFQQGDAGTAVRMLLKAKVSLSVIINAALQNGVSHDDVVGALLAAGIPPKKFILHFLSDPASFKRALAALNNHGVPPTDVLICLVKWEIGLNGIYDVCEFMLKHGYSKADILKTLAEAKADREIVVQVVRWFDIPPATVVAAYMSRPDYFGYVFNRNSLPQPALLAIGVARIPVYHRLCCPVISPMKP